MADESPGNRVEHAITAMSPEEIRHFAGTIRFRSPDALPPYVKDRLNVLTFDRDPGDRIFPHRTVEINPAILKIKKPVPYVKIHIVQQVNDKGELVGAHFLEDSGELVGFSQIIFDGAHGLKKGEPYVMWSHTDQGFDHQGRGLARTIVMGEYANQELKVGLDAGDMVLPSDPTRGPPRDSAHFVHIWELLSRAGLATDIGGYHYRYVHTV